MPDSKILPLGQVSPTSDNSGIQFCRREHRVHLFYHGIYTGNVDQGAISRNIIQICSITELRCLTQKLILSDDDITVSNVKG